MRRAAIGAMIVLIGGWCCAGCSDEKEDTVVVISPHNENIRSEFTWAFQAWHEDKYGTEVDIEGSSVCVHCDTPGAFDIVKAVRAALEQAGCELASPEI